MTIAVEDYPVKLIFLNMDSVNQMHQTNFQERLKITSHYFEISHNFRNSLYQFLAVLTSVFQYFC